MVRTHPNLTLSNILGITVTRYNTRTSSPGGVVFKSPYHNRTAFKRWCCIRACASSTDHPSRSLPLSYRRRGK